jgi:hypothetical protein
MELQLKIIGIVLLALGLVHGRFPRFFNWRDELSGVSLINRQLMYVHTLFIALFLVLIGLLCISSAKELIETDLGNRIALGLGIFWFIRLIVQFFGYSSELWRGKTFETTVHILFAILWSYLSIVFLAVYWSGH